MLIRVHKAAPRKPRVDSPEIRAAASILARNEARFARAFLKAMRALYASDEMRKLKKAISSGSRSIEAILDVLPWFNEADPNSVVFWRRFVGSIERAYTATIEDSGQYTARHYGFPMRFTVTKAELAVDIVVPINPYSIGWIRGKSATLVREISDGQREKLRELLSRNFERGVRPEAIIEEIEQVVGLTTHQAEMVMRRKDLMLAQGFPESIANMHAEKYGKEILTRRAQTIARTETVDAHTKGLEDTWQLAKDEGFMPPATKKVWQAMMDERTSQICENLDGQEVPLDQPFESDLIGPIDRPPAHPNCRSTMTLVFP